MVYKSALESVGESQKRRVCVISKSASKTEESSKGDRQLLGGDKDESSKHRIVYYRGENMSKEYAKLSSFGPNARKNPKDTTFHEIPHDHIDYRYECIRSLGKGSFGNVVLVIDHKDGKECALKVVRRDPRFTQQAKEEIAILELLQKSNPHPTSSWDFFPIVRLTRHFMFHDHMCLSFELLGCSLYDLIKDKKDQGLPRDRVRRLMASVLDGLSYVWRAGIIHCDLKPENVLLVSRATDGGPNAIRDRVKIIDFGSSCFVDKQCYPYIQSRFYRAPEVIMRLNYGQPIDMWSFGCLVFEMIRGYPLFPGEDEFDQLACMMEKLGMPPGAMVGPSRVFSRYFAEVDGVRKYYRPQDRQTALKFIPLYCTIRQVSETVNELQPNFSKKTRRLRKPPGAVPVAQALVSTLSQSSGKYIDSPPTPLEEVDNTHVVKLIEACLSWEPEKRINPEEAKTFSWFSYNCNQHNGLTQSAQMSRPTLLPNPPAASSKNSSDSSQVSLLAETIPSNRMPLSNGGFAPVVPACAAVTAAAPVPTVLPSSPHIMTARTIGGLMALAKPMETKNSTTSVSLPVLEPYKKHGSATSISSVENKQEERVIYPSTIRSHSPKSHIFEFNTGYGQNTDSLASHASSIDDMPQSTFDNPRYTKRNGVQTNERYQPPNTHSRRRNQSMEPKRHTQPVGSEEVTKEQSIQPPFSYTCSKTAVRSSSPEEDLERSGRHNPNSFRKASQMDILAVDRRAGKAINSDVRSKVPKAPQHPSPNSEAPILGKGPSLIKTRSVQEHTESLIQNDVDDLEWSSITRPVHVSLPYQRRISSRDIAQGSKVSEMEKWSTVPPVTRSYETTEKVKFLRPRTHNKHHRKDGKVRSAVIKFPEDQSLAYSNSIEALTNPRPSLRDSVGDKDNNLMNVNQV